MSENSINELKLNILKTKHFTAYEKKNPKSAQQLKKLLKNIPVAPGLENTLNQILKEKNKWMNFFSELRCAYFFHCNGHNITGYNVLADNKEADADFVVNNNFRCDVTSFKQAFDTLISGTLTTFDYSNVRKYLLD